MIISGRYVGATGGSPSDSAKCASISLLLVFLLGLTPQLYAQQDKKPLEKVRLAVAAKALTLLPYYFGKSKGLFEREGIDLEIIAMRPPVGVTALQAGEVDYGGSTGVALRGAIKGLPLKAYMFYPDALELHAGRPAGHDAGAHAQHRRQRHRLAGALRRRSRWRGDWAATAPTTRSFTSPPTRRRVVSSAHGQSRRRGDLDAAVHFDGDVGGLCRSRRYLRRARPAGRHRRRG